VTLITAIALITISVSTYATLHAHALYQRLRRPLTSFERHGARTLRDEPAPGDERVDVILLGAGRFGGALLRPLQVTGHRVLVVDFDPRVVERARAAGHLARFGDAEDPELPASLPLDGVRWVVSTVRRPAVGLALLHALERHGYTGQVLLSAHDREDAETLLERGAHHVLQPYEAAAASALASVMEQAPEARYGVSMSGTPGSARTRTPP
jgi:voltage-gated potassium channel Kch